MFDNGQTNFLNKFNMDFKKKILMVISILCNGLKNYPKKFYPKKLEKNVKTEKLEISITTTLHQMASDFVCPKFFKAVHFYTLHTYFCGFLSQKK
jgi:hypothetical protein